MTVEYIHLFSRYNGSMNDAGTNKRVPLIVLLAIFAICNVYVCMAVNEYLSRATTSYFEKDFYSTEISFTEDIECVDNITWVNWQIDEAMGNKERTEIKLVTIQKGKKYKLKSDLLIVTGKKWKYEDQIKLAFDDHTMLPIDLYARDGKIEEIHNEYLDGTYYTQPPMSKVESYEKVLSECEKALDDYIASQKRGITREDVLSAIVPLIVSMAVAAVFLLIHRVLMVKGRSSMVLVVIAAILDVPLILLSVFLLFSL